MLLINVIFFGHKQIAVLAQQLAAKSVLPPVVQSSSASDSARIKQLEALLAEQTERYETVAKEQEDLLVCLAEGDLTIRQLKDRLRALGQEVESDEDDEDDEEE
jgi:septal ring factor EnvC (AmiA/AmiB activator)